MPKKDNQFGERIKTMHDLFKDKRKKKLREKIKIDYLEKKMDQLPAGDLKSEINRLSRASTTTELNKFQIYKLKAAKKALFNAKANPKRYEITQNKKQKEEDQIVTYSKQQLDELTNNIAVQSNEDSSDVTIPQNNNERLNYQQREKVRELDPLLNPEIDYKIDKQTQFSKQVNNIFHKTSKPTKTQTGLIGNYESDNEDNKNSDKEEAPHKSIQPNAVIDKAASELSDFYSQISKL